MKLTLKETRTAGKISDRNSKMPGSTFATSAFHCHVGAKLSKVEGSVCNRCYAQKLQKLRPSVNKGWTENTEKAIGMIARAPETWSKYMAFQITKSAEKSGELFHRWFDSGDLDSVDMLRAICDVARATPTVSHWLPTREAKIVKDYKRDGGDVPSNLVIRVSSTMIGDAPIPNHANTSTVHRKGGDHIGHACPASQQGNACGDCRACWDDTVPNVSYPLH